MIVIRLIAQLQMYGSLMLLILEILEERQENANWEAIVVIWINAVLFYLAPFISDNTFQSYMHCCLGPISLKLK